MIKLIKTKICKWNCLQRTRFQNLKIQSQSDTTPNLNLPTIICNKRKPKRHCKWNRLPRTNFQNWQTLEEFPIWHDADRPATVDTNQPEKTRARFAPVAIDFVGAGFSGGWLRGSR